jgi:Na+-driven multidrug efflux pump
MVIIAGIFAAFSAVMLILCSDIIVRYGFKITDIKIIIESRIVFSLLWATLVLLLLVQCCLFGILSSGGDTKFVTYVRISSIILCIGIPIYILFSHGKLSVRSVWELIVIQYLFNGGFFYLRYKSGKWKNKLVN